MTATHDGEDASDAPEVVPGIIGRSAPMRELADQLRMVAPTQATVLIQGDSGTGKELVAREIRRNGLRRDKPYLTENCAAIAETLLESELFGHVKGSFTGAERDHTGLFVQADGGTLFLDEIGDMPASMQARLLRVLQEGEVRPVGSEQRQRVDVRVIAATHRNLEQAVAAGKFREDLFYRLQVLVIQVPRLIDRPGDVLLLTDHFLERTGREMGRATPGIEPRVMELLERCDWPGNVRQLENAIQRLVLLAGDGTITRALVESDPGLRAMLLAESAAGPVFSLERNEKQQIEEALRVSDGNRVRAAEMLGISRATIFRKIKTYGLS